MGIIDCRTNLFDFIAMGSFDDDRICASISIRTTPVIFRLPIDCELEKP